MLEILNLPPQAMPPQTCLNEKMAHTLIHTHTHTHKEKEKRSAVSSFMP